MQAAVVTAFKKPLEIQELAIPAPGPGQILVKTEACGVCHTDLHAANGDWPLKPTPPFIPGHEAIGKRVASRVDTGMMFINNISWSDAELPFGGIKNSGYGRELGDMGIQEFVNKKLVRYVSAEAPV
jgi:hypothetical protein